MGEKKTDACPLSREVLFRRNEERIPKTEAVYLSNEAVLSTREREEVISQEEAVFSSDRRGILEKRSCARGKKRRGLVGEKRTRSRVIIVVGKKCAGDLEKQAHRLAESQTRNGGGENYPVLNSPV